MNTYSSILAWRILWTVEFRSPCPGQHLIFVDLLEDGHSEGCELISRSFDLSHFSNSDAEHLFISCIAIWMP